MSSAVAHSVDLIANLHSPYVRPAGTDQSEPATDASVIKLGWATGDDAAIASEDADSFSAPVGISSAVLTIRFHYDPADPCLVKLTFTGLPSTYPWLVGRDLLTDGVQRASGDGDVHVATASGVDGDITVLTLRTPETLCTPEAYAIFTLSTDDLIDFLGHTEDLVPLGDECGRVQHELATADWEQVQGDHDHPSDR